MPLCKHLDIHGRATRSKIWYQKFRVDNEALYDIYIYIQNIYFIKMQILYLNTGSSKKEHNVQNNYFTLYAFACTIKTINIVLLAIRCNESIVNLATDFHHCKTLCCQSL